MKHGWWSLVLVLGVCGCFQDSGNSGPPDLKLADVVGCWKNSLDSCKDQCFDRAGTYLFEDKPVGAYQALEDSGGYSISGFVITDISKNEFLNSNTFNLGSETSHIKRQGNLLVDLLEDGTPTQDTWSMVSPDSFSCGIKPWRVFNKPAGWDSLVQPLP
jgi:hypothetical protein